LLVALSFVSSHAAAQSADTPSDQGISGEWRHHKVSFDYVGFTALYTCPGLEDRVTQILRHLGARHDVKVSARGCPGPYNAPSRTAWVTADFYTLAPAAEPSGADTVTARWMPVELRPQRPYFMGAGDCELMQGMKDLITKNFSLRNIRYRTDCFPNTLTLDAFAINGQILRAAPQKPAAGHPIIGRPVKS
jgi:hypothetical protein